MSKKKKAAELTHNEAEAQRKKGHSGVYDKK